MKVDIGKYKKNRKIKIRIDEWDTWNCDSTLALIIHPLLIQFKKTTHGIIGVDNEDVPEHLHSDEHNTQEKMDYILDAMIWSFNHLIHGELWLQTEEEGERLQFGLQMFGKYFTALWD